MQLIEKSEFNCAWYNDKDWSCRKWEKKKKWRERFKKNWLRSYMHVNLWWFWFFGPVWYMCLKTENCCLKIFVEIRVGEKCVEMREMLFKMLLWHMACLLCLNLKSVVALKTKLYFSRFPLCLSLFIYLFIYFWDS